MRSVEVGFRRRVNGNFKSERKGELRIRARFDTQTQPYERIRVQVPGSRLGARIDFNNAYGMVCWTAATTLALVKNGSQIRHSWSVKWG